MKSDLENLGEVHEKFEQDNMPWISLLSQNVSGRGADGQN